MYEGQEHRSKFKVTKSKIRFSLLILNQGYWKIIYISETISDGVSKFGMLMNIDGI